MKRSYAVLSAFGLGIFVLGTATLLVKRLSDQPPPGLTGPRDTSEPLVLGVVPDFSLTNQFGEVVRREDLLGKPWVADIIFTRCPGPCARMTALMAGLQDTLNELGEVRLVSLTTDPLHDTPEVLQQYARKNGARPDQWHFLTGPKAEVLGLAIHGLKLAAAEIPEADRESVNDLFVHSTRLVVVDAQGRVRGAVEGTTEEGPREVKAILERLQDQE